MDQVELNNSADALDVLSSYWEQIEAFPSGKRLYRELFAVARELLSGSDTKKKGGMIRPVREVVVGSHLISEDRFSLSEEVGFVYNAVCIRRSNLGDFIKRPIMEEINMVERKICYRQPIEAVRYRLNLSSGVMEITGRLNLDQLELFGINFSEEMK